MNRFISRPQIGQRVRITAGFLAGESGEVTSVESHWARVQTNSGLSMLFDWRTEIERAEVAR